MKKVMGLEHDLKEFKTIVKSSWRKNIEENYHTLQQFADEKGYRPEEVERFLNFDFDTVDDFMEMMWNMDCSLLFEDRYDNEMIFSSDTRRDELEANWHGPEGIPEEE